MVKNIVLWNVLMIVIICKTKYLNRKEESWVIMAVYFKTSHFSKLLKIQLLLMKKKYLQKSVYHKLWLCAHSLFTRAFPHFSFRWLTYQIKKKKNMNISYNLHEQNNSWRMNPIHLFSLLSLKHFSFIFKLVLRCLLSVFIQKELEGIFNIVGRHNSYILPPREK